MGGAARAISDELLYQGARRPDRRSQWRLEGSGVWIVERRPHALAEGRRQGHARRWRSTSRFAPIRWRIDAGSVRTKRRASPGARRFSLRARTRNPVRETPGVAIDTVSTCAGTTQDCGQPVRRIIASRLRASAAKFAPRLQISIPSRQLRRHTDSHFRTCVRGTPDARTSLSADRSSEGYGVPEPAFSAIRALRSAARRPPSRTPRRSLVQGRLGTPHGAPRCPAHAHASRGRVGPLPGS